MMKMGTTTSPVVATMTDDLVRRWDDYVESMGSVMGDVEHMAQQMRDHIEALMAERDEALEGLEKCQAELDEYSHQEYPLDHPVHERYRQRDYDANPARITLAALKGESHD